MFKFLACSTVAGLVTALAATALSGGHTRPRDAAAANPFAGRRLAMVTVGPAGTADPRGSDAVDGVKAGDDTRLEFGATTDRAVSYLLGRQAPDGSWGAGGHQEPRTAVTALVLEALVSTRHANQKANSAGQRTSVRPPPDVPGEGIRDGLEVATALAALASDDGSKSQGGVCARCYALVQVLRARGIPTVQNRQGETRDWRLEVVGMLSRRQRRDGSWHAADCDPVLATAYAVLALAEMRRDLAEYPPVSRNSSRAESLAN